MTACLRPGAQDCTIKKSIRNMRNSARGSVLTYYAGRGGAVLPRSRPASVLLSAC